MKIDLVKNFQDRMSELKAICTAFGKRTRGKIHGTWMFTKSDPLHPETEGDVRTLDHEGVAELFDRSEAGKQYGKVLDEPEDSVRQQMALAKNQSDLLASMERDFRVRHRSRIRMLAHETTARLVTGSDRGIIESGVLASLQKQATRLQGDTP